MATAKKIETILKKENPKGEEIGRALLLYQKYEKENADRPHAPLFTQDQYNKMTRSLLERNSKTELNKYLIFDALHGLITDSQIYLKCMQQQFFRGYQSLFCTVAEAVRAERFLTTLSENNVAIKFTATEKPLKIFEIADEDLLKDLMNKPPEYYLKTGTTVQSLPDYLDSLHGVSFFELNPGEIELINKRVNELMKPALRFLVDYNNFVELFKVPLNLEFLDYSFFDFKDIKASLKSYNRLLTLLAESVAGDPNEKTKKVEFLNNNFKPLEFSELTAGAKLATGSSSYNQCRHTVNQDPFNITVRKLVKTFPRSLFSAEINTTAE